MAALSVVICGSGIAGAEGLLRLHRLAGERVDVTLLSPSSELVYRPLTVLEPFVPARAPRYSIERLLDYTGAQWIRDSLDWVDRERRILHANGGTELPYDAALLAVGGREVPPSPYMDVFTGRDGGYMYESIVSRILTEEIRSVAFALPPGPVWALPLYELALLTARRAHLGGRTPELSFVISDSRPLQAFGGEAGEIMTRLLREAGIVLHTDCDARADGPCQLTLDPGGVVLHPDRIVALPRVTGPNVRGIPGFAADRFLHVDEYCRVHGTDGRIFAAGDATYLAVKHGGVGAQQADTAAAGIAALAGVAVPVEPLRPKIEGTLYTGAAPLHLSAYLIDGQGWQASLDARPRSPEPDKLVAEELGAYLRQVDS